MTIIILTWGFIRVSSLNYDFSDFDKTASYTQNLFQNL